jgi:O-antigen ligase
VTPSWSSPETVGGLLAAMIFAAICFSDLRRGVIVFTVAGCVRSVQIGAFAGGDSVQGLFLVEAFAAVMVVVWLVTRGPHSMMAAPFNTPLFLFLPVSAISLIAGFIAYDPTIALDHMKVSVSLAQILLTMWPIATYLAVANAVDNTKTIDTIRKVVVIFALPSLLLMVAPSVRGYVEWSTSFALAASSFCFAECFETQSVWRRCGLLVVVFAPVVYGVQMGKAFYYTYVLVSVAAISCFKARRLLIALAPIALAAYVVAAPLASGALTPSFVSALVEHEEEEQSLGGSGGRDQLIMDGLGIWARSPVLGVGPGNNYPYMLRYSSLGTAHNQYVNILMELGIVGLACFVAFAYKAVRMGLALLRTARHPTHRTLALGWLGMFGGFLVGGFFGDFMLPSIRNAGLELFAEFYVQWIVLGLIVSAAAIERRQAAGSRRYEYA